MCVSVVDLEAAGRQAGMHAVPFVAAPRLM
jgi:hypothetical protein